MTSAVKAFLVGIVLFVGLILVAFVYFNNQDVSVAQREVVREIQVPRVAQSSGVIDPDTAPSVYTSKVPDFAVPQVKVAPGPLPSPQGEAMPPASMGE